MEGIEVDLVRGNWKALCGLVGSCSTSLGWSRASSE